jgi:hypothetical protein
LSIATCRAHFQIRRRRRARAESHMEDGRTRRVTSSPQRGCSAVTGSTSTRREPGAAAWNVGLMACSLARR